MKSSFRRSLGRGNGTWAYRLWNKRMQPIVNGAKLLIGLDQLFFRLLQTTENDLPDLLDVLSGLLEQFQAILKAQPTLAEAPQTRGLVDSRPAYICTANLAEL